MIEYDFSGKTNIGRRKVNQDSFFCEVNEKNNRLFALVADGMGGLAGGGRASEIVTTVLSAWHKESVTENIFKGSKEDIVKMLLDMWIKRIAAADSIIKRDKFAGGTTLTMILLCEGIYYIANIGDSRAYRYTESKLYQLTEDHSWVQEQLDKGVSADVIESNEEMKNKITRCIGLQDPFPGADYYMGSYSPGDVLFLCSDGLRHKVRVKDFESILSKDIRANDMADRMIKKAYNSGEKDNMTAVVIKIKGK